MLHASVDLELSEWYHGTVHITNRLSKHKTFPPGTQDLSNYIHMHKTLPLYIAGGICCFHVLYIYLLLQYI